ncbi:unnamed protein product [Linum trigynum]|uniref:Uncharacterized protein n=1 Tax=Linum trigynum TaxID=586398 RepID=A0AAV2E209_9ROSI
MGEYAFRLLSFRDLALGEFVFVPGEIRDDEESSSEETLLWGSCSTRLCSAHREKNKFPPKTILGTPRLAANSVVQVKKVSATKQSRQCCSNNFLRGSAKVEAELEKWAAGGFVF